MQLPTVDGLESRRGARQHVAARRLASFQLVTWYDENNSDEDHK